MDFVVLDCHPTPPLLEGLKTPAAIDHQLEVDLNRLDCRFQTWWGHWVPTRTAKEFWAWKPTTKQARLVTQAGLAQHWLFTQNLYPQCHILPDHDRRIQIRVHQHQIMNQVYFKIYTTDMKLKTRVLVRGWHEKGHSHYSLEEC